MTPHADHLTHHELEQVLALPTGPSSDVIRAELIVGVLQALIGPASATAASDSTPSDDPQSMLTVAQTAALLGISRMTVIRKADTGELPCVVISRGTHQKLRRFPRAMIEYLAVGGGTDTDLKDCAAQWLASLADRGGTA